MPTDGIELLARWREAGEWWVGEAPKEWARYLDAQGIRREKCRDLPLLMLPGVMNPGEPDGREDYDVRIRKRRDEKVARACGLIQDPDLVQVQRQDREAALLHIVSGYSFGRSVLMAEEASAHVAYRGYSAALIADRFSLAGVREFANTAHNVGIRSLMGATLELADGGEIVLVAQNAVGFRSLSRLISECHLKEPRGYPLATWERLRKHTEGLLMLTGGDPGPINRELVRRDVDSARRLLKRFVDLYGRENVFVQIERAFLPWEIVVNRRLLEIAKSLDLVPLAGGAVTHLEPGAFPAQDVMVCVESLCEIDEIEGRKPRRGEGQPEIRLPPRRALNAERYLHTAAEMKKLYADRPDLVENTLRFVDRCEHEKDILPGMAQLPKLVDDENGLLRHKVYQGARLRYPNMSKSEFDRIELELNRILNQRFAAHFLVAADMCDWAREQGILFSGRGSVVDSAVAYCLGLSRIDAHEHKLHFDRFLPEGSENRPDIDIDFEAARRNDIRQYLVQKYGEDHVATVAAFGAYRTRGIIRDVGKVLGIPPESLTYLSKRLHGSVTPDRLREAIQDKPELRDSGIPVQRFEWVFRLAGLLMDVPMGIRAHSSGVVISRDPVWDTVPVMLSADEDVRIIQWDKRSAKRSFDKFDVLCLRGNDVLAGAQSRIRLTDCEFDVEAVPLNDPGTYETMRRGQLIGIPQSASPAMRQAHIRLRTNDLIDASLVQAGIRPGVGGAVKLNELIKRRRADEWPHYHPKLDEILDHTYGLVVFQEQVDMLLERFGKYTADEAETIRESIHKKRRESYVNTIREKTIARFMSNGCDIELATHVYDLVAGFQGYGFAQGHALAFAEVSVRSIWCQQNYPAEYFSALLDSQPAGYYGPCTIANEARARGVKILHPDVNKSDKKFSVEDLSPEPRDPDVRVPHGGIRVALEQIGGVSEATVDRLLEKRKSHPYRSFFDFVARVRPDRDELEMFILAGAFDSLAPNRRALLWAIPRAQEYAALCNIKEDSLDLPWEEPELPPDIEDFDRVERAIRERQVLDLDIDHHLMGFERERVKAKGIITTQEAGALTAGTKAFVVGNPIRLRFPPTGSGHRVMFFDLEDETGLLNVTCFDRVYQRYGHAIICSPYITLYGEAQDRDGHTAFLTHRVYNYQPRLGTDVDVRELPITTADFLVS